MEKSVSVVAGGAGFIGVSIVEKLLAIGKSVTVIDNFSRGDYKHLERFKAADESFKVIQADISDVVQCSYAFSECAKNGNVIEVWHLAANSDIQAGIQDSGIDLKDTFLTTYQILCCMERHKIAVLNFASSSAVYGDFGSEPLVETLGPLLPISNYGAMKLASEAQISAAAERFLKRANIFRFPNVVGIPATHGVILDFVRKLLLNPNKLPVLGDGSQKKAYLHISDLVDAMFAVNDSDTSPRIEVVNIGPTDDGVSVSWIAQEVVKSLSPNANIEYGHGCKGWVGDVPKFSYSTNKIQSYGWKPKYQSAAAVSRAIREVIVQETMLQK